MPRDHGRLSSDTGRSAHGADEQPAGPGPAALVSAGDAVVRRMTSEGRWSERHGPRQGGASFYGTSRSGDPRGDGFAGRRMANGQPMDPTALIAAHKSLPFGTQVRVRHLRSGAEVVVVICDRGPYAHGRIIDLSPAAAQALGLIDEGVGQVELSLAE